MALCLTSRTPETELGTATPASVSTSIAKRGRMHMTRGYMTASVHSSLRPLIYLLIYPYIRSLNLYSVYPSIVTLSAVHSGRVG
jgi:hypothetical protein